MTSKTNKILIKKLPGFSTVWHEESQLVFKSAKELVVIGKLVEKEIVGLTEDDIQVCDKYKFKYEIEEEEEEEVVSGEEQDAVAAGAEEEGGGSDDVPVEEEEVEATTDEEVPEKTKVEEVVPEVKKEVIKPKEEAPTPPPVAADDFTTAVTKITTIWTVTNSQYKSQIKDLENDLDKTRKELANLQEMYDKMKVKFDGIRQLFAV
jgi:hypothetical protein